MMAIRSVTVMAILRWLAFSLYLVVSLLAIYLLSEHPYEWMIGESLPGESPVTYCTLPDPSDSTLDIGIVVGVLLIAIGAGIGLFWRKGKTGRTAFICAGLLMAVAVYRFFLRSVFC